MTTQPTPTHTTAMECAEKGLRWLQESGPQYDLDWRRIDIDRLNIVSHSHCALAQAGNDVYSTLMQRIHGGDTEAAACWGNQGWANDHGFAYAAPGMYPGDLNVAWRTLLTREHELAAAASVLEA